MTKIRTALGTNAKGRDGPGPKLELPWVDTNAKGRTGRDGQSRKIQRYAVGSRRPHLQDQDHKSVVGAPSYKTKTKTKH